VDDIVIHRPDGHRAHIRAQASPIFDGERISHVAIAFIDISREVEAQLAQEEFGRRLQRAQRLESIGTLAGGIAHDFNNLLATIKITATTLQLHEANPERRAALQLIDDVTSSASELTRSLLGFARRGKNLAAPISLNSVVRTVGHLAHRMMEGRVAVVQELNAEPDTVFGDFAQLEQVVMNLVINARDAISGSGAIMLRTSNAPSGEVQLEVIDTGSGIDKSIRDRVFEPYFTTKTAGPQRGTGLGLATVYGIVEAHGGSIELVDNVPRGTVMRVTLARCDQPAPAATAPSPQAPATTRPGEGKLVLVVEDEPNVGGALRTGLEDLGYEVVLATNGDEGVTAFRQHHARLSAVVLDMVMPKMSGRDAYLAMREVDAKVPVLLTTGSSHNEEVQRIMDLGVAGFIAKPFSVTRLSEEIRRAVARA
jgi:signal transduction histidine kinase/CheY-like chemotaxis protein